MDYIIVKSLGQRGAAAPGQEHVRQGSVAAKEPRDTAGKWRQNN